MAIGAPLQEQGIDLPSVARNDVLIRVRAAGICHSDAHYRAGVSPVARLPLSLGHEVAGVVEDVGPGVTNFKTGDRVCVHYLVTCGECDFCSSGHEQFCPSAEMIGKHRDGGYAEFIALPERSVFRLPGEIPFEQGAIMMCSSATSLHALRKARLKPGETVAVFGVGGLGISAIQLASALGAARVFAIDINSYKLGFAERFGAIPIDASAGDPLTQLRELTDSRGVDVALELVGLPVTMIQAVQSLGILGRAALVGLTQERFEVAPYLELLNKEAEIIGVSDHLASDIPVLLDFVRERKLDLSGDLIRTVPLESDAINDAIDGLANFGDDVRTVIVV
jgi:D-arabinose 1-dehydrogenase-like Zn-dependent alcohol dehydrogenase